MKSVLHLLCFPLQGVLFRLDHIPVAHMVPKLFLQCVQLPGQLLVLDPGDLFQDRIHLPENCPVCFLRLPFQAVQLLDQTGQQMHLLLFLLLLRPILLCLLPDGTCLLPEEADPVPAPDLHLVVLILGHIFLQQVLKFLHPALLPVQPALHRVQKPFLHQPLLVPAVGEELRQTGLLQVHLLDDGLPLLIIDLVLHQLVKILPGLGGICTVITEKAKGSVLFPGVKQLPARRKIFQYHLLRPFFHHRQMMDILQTRLPVFADECHHVQPLVVLRLRLLAPADHHPGQYISRPLVQHPFHQDKRRPAGGKIALKRPVFGIPIPLVYKGRRYHLHQH